MRIAVTGADGFLGWHVRCRLRALSDHDIVPIGRVDWPSLDALIEDVDAVLHVAGINRADDAATVQNGNVQLAKDLAEAVRRARQAPAVVFANSAQVGNGTPYGTGKASGAEILRGACEAVGAPFADVLLPNLFGEHGRPNYNSFVATFVHRIAVGAEITVQDREIELLHVQDAAANLIEAVGSNATSSPMGTATTVQRVHETLLSFHNVYRRGEIPALLSSFDIALFNTYRSAVFPGRYPFVLNPQTDRRGALVETVRSHGGEGQTFVSTTKPDVTRGEHYHLRKVERFAVIQGEAKIILRRLLTNETVAFDVSGDRPTAIDMPTFWVHNITNTGDDDLITMFWTNELFNPDDTDTFYETVRTGATT